jgi:hypothetical protein
MAYLRKMGITGQLQGDDIGLKRFLLSQAQLKANGIFLSWPPKLRAGLQS